MKSGSKKRIYFISLLCMMAMAGADSLLRMIVSACAQETAGKEWHKKVPTVSFTDSNLPIVVIETNGKRIRNATRTVVDMGIIDNGTGKRNRITDPFNDYEGKINIEIRGSSGQWQNWPKIQYAFETQDSLGNNLNTSLLGLPEENDWILHPPYSDKSLIRNALVYKLTNDIGHYASRTVFCELVLDGDYRGVYLVMEKIKRDKNRVDISRLDPDDVSGDRLTGGYIIKIDRDAGEENDGWDSEFMQSTRRVRYLYHYPKPFDIVQEQKTYIRNFVHNFELLMSRTDWKSSYLEYFDLEEFIDYWIINELTRNVDAYSLSTFLHKDRDSMGGKLVFGPVWDYNLGFGNVNYYTGEETAGLMLERKVVLSDRIPFWLANFLRDEEVKKRFADRWFVLRRDLLSLDRIYAIIDDWVVRLDEAQRRNFERWRILGQYVWPNNFVGDTYQEEIAYLKRWIRDRISWMDGYLATGVVMVSSNEDRVSYLGQNYPNPFNGKTTIPFYLPTSDCVVIEFFDMLGRRIDVRSYGETPAGPHRIVFDADVFSSGQYFYRLRTDRGTESKAMQVVK